MNEPMDQLKEAYRRTSIVTTAGLRHGPKGKGGSEH